MVGQADRKVYNDVCSVSVLYGSETVVPHLMRVNIINVRYLKEQSKTWQGLNTQESEFMINIVVYGAAGALIVIALIAFVRLLVFGRTKARWIVAERLLHVGFKRAGMFYLDQALESEPENIKLRLARASWNNVLQNYDQALRDFSVVIQLSQNIEEQVTALEGRARTHLHHKEFFEGIKDMDAAINLKPQSAPLYLFRAQLKVGAWDERGMRQEMLLDALKDCENSLCIDPGLLAAKDYLRKIKELKSLHDRKRQSFIQNRDNGT